MHRLLRGGVLAIRVTTIVVACAIVASGARAQVEARPDLALLVGPIDARLEARVRGQTGDLGWTIEVASPEDATVDGVTRAREAAIAAGARIAFAVDEIDAEVDVAIVEREPGAEPRSEVRHLGLAHGRLGDSARVEAISLIVRSLLLERVPAPRPVTPPSDAPPPEPPVVAPPVTPPPPQPPLRSVPRVSFVAAASGSVAIDGAAPRGNLGPRLRLGAAIDDLEIGLDAHLAPDETLVDGALTTHLTRFDVLAQAGLGRRLDPAVTLAIGIGVGATVHLRGTAVAQPSTLAPTPDATLVSFTGLLEARLAWWPVQVLGVELTAGTLATSSPPVLVVRSATGTDVTLHALWPVLPRIALGVVLRLP